LPWWGHIVYQIANTHSVVNDVKKDIKKKTDCGTVSSLQKEGKIARGVRKTKM